MACLVLDDACGAAWHGAGTWQDAGTADGGTSAAGGGSGLGAGGARISQQWSPMAVAAAGGGPSRLKDPLPVFRHHRPLPAPPPPLRGLPMPPAGLAHAQGPWRLVVCTYSETLGRRLDMSALAVSCLDCETPVSYSWRVSVVWRWGTSQCSLGMGVWCRPPHG